MNISLSKLVSAACCVALVGLAGCNWQRGDSSTKVTETTKVKKEDGGTVVKKTRTQKTVREDKATTRMQGNGY